MSDETHPAPPARERRADSDSPAPSPPTDPATDDAPILPPPETLGESDDWSGFLSPKTGAQLQKRALRRLFHLPRFHLRDGLDDYDDDFTQFEPLGELIPAEMRRQLERVRAAAEEAASAEIAPTADSEADANADAAKEDDAPSRLENDRE